VYSQPRSHTYTQALVVHSDSLILCTASNYTQNTARCLNFSDVCLVSTRAHVELLLMQAQQQQQQIENIGGKMETGQQAERAGLPAVRVSYSAGKLSFSFVDNKAER